MNNFGKLNSIRDDIVALQPGFAMHVDQLYFLKLIAQEDQIREDKAKSAKPISQEFPVSVTAMLEKYGLETPEIPSVIDEFIDWLPSVYVKYEIHEARSYEFIKAVRNFGLSDDFRTRIQQQSEMDRLMRKSGDLALGGYMLGVNHGSIFTRLLTYR